MGQHPVWQRRRRSRALGRYTLLAQHQPLCENENIVVAKGGMNGVMGWGEKKHSVTEQWAKTDLSGCVKLKLRHMFLCN